MKKFLLFYLSLGQDLEEESPSKKSSPSKPGEGGGVYLMKSNAANPDIELGHVLKNGKYYPVVQPDINALREAVIQTR